MTTTTETAPVATTRIRMLQSFALLVVAVIPWPTDWDTVRGMVDSARSPELNRAEREGHTAGYYEGLISGNDGSEVPSGEPSLRLIGEPHGLVRFQEADVVHYLDDDFLQFELKPRIRRTLFGQPFLTNAFGMHDDPVAIEKPEGTIRIAVLGSSMDMGWGVRYQDTYINQLEEWLDAHAVRKGITPARRFEVLNFAVAAYSPMQRLETLRRKVLAFQPDLVIYSATTLDTRLMEIHLCDLLRKNVDLKYDFLRTAASLAAIDHDDSSGSERQRDGCSTRTGSRASYGHFIGGCTTRHSARSPRIAARRECRSCSWSSPASARRTPLRSALSRSRG